MARVYRPTYTDKNGTKKISRVWRIAYKNEHGERVTASGLRDKRAAKTRAATPEHNAERARAGLPASLGFERGHLVPD
jgi:hypothetical protein